MELYNAGSDPRVLFLRGVMRFWERQKDEGRRQNGKSVRSQHPDCLTHLQCRLGAAKRNPTSAEDFGLFGFCYRATQPTRDQSFSALCQSVRPGSMLLRSMLLRRMGDKPKSFHPSFFCFHHCLRFPSPCGVMRFWERQKAEGRTGNLLEARIYAAQIYAAQKNGR